jgi:hypothetical protein
MRGCLVGWWVGRELKARYCVLRVSGSGCLGGLCWAKGESLWVLGEMREMRREI